MLSLMEVYSMTDQHPIIPPLELLKHWEDQHFDGGENYDVVLIQAYQAGADQELEACCNWVDANFGQEFAQNLRLLHRPKPPSLKQQALQALANADGADHPVVATVLTADQHALIRKALEQLND